MSMTKPSVISQRTLIIASSNPGKIREFISLLDNLSLDIRLQPGSLNLNFQETGLTFAENAYIKAAAVAAATGCCALADDSGLCVDALNGAPGIHSARYAPTETARIIKLLTVLKNTDNRRASFQAALCIATPDGSTLAAVEGHCDGLITIAPRGQGGFGYDPIFEVAHTGMTFAEMSPSRKQALGHRGRAFTLLRQKLMHL